MPPSRTPLRAPPRQHARPQFASTPRFLFSQRAPVSTKEADSITAEDESDHVPSSRPAQTPARAPRRKEVIEDSGSDLEPDDLHQQSGNHNGFTQDGNRNGFTQDGVAGGSPPSMTEMDAEMEELLGPTKHRDKRRRVSGDGKVNSSLATPDTRKGRKKLFDSIESSPPEPSPLPSTAEPPSPSLPYRSTPQNKSQRTPRPAPPGTPASGPSKASIRSYPRFLAPSSSQPPPKPTFVLPRSPSPDQDQAGNSTANTIPTPFSPSSNALRRRGRQRSSAQSYLPGGMAAEVRSWVLEMGSTREQQMKMQMRMPTQGAGITHGIDSAGYSLILRISDVRQSALGSCGPLAFIQGQSTHMASGESLNGRNPTDDVTKNVLLTGAPRLRPGELRPSSRVPGLQAGDVVGILRGLVWELNLGVDPDSLPRSDDERELRGACEQTLGLELGSGKWLVGMEWEVLSSV